MNSNFKIFARQYEHNEMKELNWIYLANNMDWTQSFFIYIKWILVDLEYCVILVINNVSSRYDI